MFKTRYGWSLLLVGISILGIAWIIFSGEPNVPSDTSVSVRLVVSKVQPQQQQVKPVEKPKPLNKPKPIKKEKQQKEKKVEIKPKPKPVRQAKTEVVKVEPEQAVELNPTIEVPEPVVETVEPVSQPQLNPVDVSMIENVNPTKSEPIIPTPLFLVTKNPVAVYEEEPEYPKAKQEFGEEGVVLASWIVDKDGSVKQIQIIQSPGKEFEEAVIAALNRSKFQPGYVNDQAVAVKVSQEFKFELD